MFNEKYNDMKEMISYFRDKGLWPSFSTDTELRWTRFDGVKDVCEITVDQSFCNLSQNVHGGAMATLIDVISSWSLLHKSGPGLNSKGEIISRGWETMGVTQNMNITYVGAANIGDILVFETIIIQQGKTLGILQTRVTEKLTGRLIALGNHVKVDNAPKPSL